MNRLQHILILILITSYTLSAQLKHNIKLSNVSAINSNTLDFSPSFYKEGVVFVSCNAAKGKKKTFDSHIHKTAMSVFIARRNDNGELEKPEPFSLDMVTSLHEGPLCFDRFNEVVYFCRNDVKKTSDNKGETANYVNGFSHMKIYAARRTANGWAKAEALPFNDDDSDACHPSISADGNRLFFASNRKGGLGGMDLYMCEKVYGEWGQPVNLGATINTASNEVFPYFHDNYVLFYSKDGNNKRDDLDIFYTQNNEMGGFTAPQNMGLPFNSEGDDFGLIIDQDNKSGYLTSDRVGGKGEDDIYAFSAPYGFDFLIKNKIPNPKNINAVTIKVTDSQSGNPLSNAVISMATTSTLEDNVKNPTLKFEHFLADKDGKIILILSSQDSYLIKTTAKNYQPAEISILKNNAKSEFSISADAINDDSLAQKDSEKSHNKNATVRE